MSDHFMTDGDLITNDPVNSTFHVVIGGKVVPGLRAIPQDLVLEGISGNESHQLGFTIFDFRGGPLGVKKFHLEKADTAANFEISYEAVSPEDLSDEPGAKGGFDFTVVLKPGLPLGPINQKIHVTLDREGSDQIVVPIRGRVVGDITFLGPGYDAAKGFVALGTVSSETGISRTVHVMVKGPQRHEMDLKVTRLRPEGVLEATLGEPRQINDGAVVMIPLEIRIPTGAPAGDHLGNEPGSMGLIQLESSGPRPEKALLYASFLVEK
jgi:hypothetical protein